MYRRSLQSYVMSFSAFVSFDYLNCLTKFVYKKVFASLPLWANIHKPDRLAWHIKIISPQEE